MSPTSFRGLVLISLLVQLASGLIDYFFPSFIPPAILKALEDEPMPAMFESYWFMAASTVWVVASLAGTIGLLFFKRWARSVSLVCTVLGFALIPLYGPGVSSGVSNWLAELANMFWGAALAIAYFSPLRERFASAAVPANPSFNGTPGGAR